ncbi:hypothetical protein GCM10010211_26320 [Streptomyces albospinus]|uniref:HTH cro/C1-type domain-containing protein n=2 Tax=Streptomyces albospinus TaxID=285515 RepID=A0ABQ2UYB2_9ACTN|nr:hypothetical protein GCM10010211_26320 [Streptomyces albospinus]
MVGMTEKDWRGRLAERVAEAVRRYRNERGMSAQALADACAEIGYEIPRTVIANLENGRRASVEIADLLVLAKALKVPPIALLMPVGVAGTIEVLPGQEVSIWDAVTWFTAEVPLGDEPSEGTIEAKLYEFRLHAQVLSAAQKAVEFADGTRRTLSMVHDPEQRAINNEMQEKLDDYARHQLKDLRGQRNDMRKAGLVPPALPEDLAYVDFHIDEKGDIYPLAR